MDQQRETGLPPHVYMAVTQGGCQKGKERRGRRKGKKKGRERRGKQDEQKRVEQEEAQTEICHERGEELITYFLRPTVWAASEHSQEIQTHRTVPSPS